MPSERSRYIDKNRGPEMPLGMDELRLLLPSIGSDRLTELLWIRAQDDEVLMRALVASICLRRRGGEWAMAKGAIEYALHFPDFIRYTEAGHGIILEEIIASLQELKDHASQEFAIRAARFAIERAEEVAENFEDDWEWCSSLNELKNWVESLKPMGAGE